MTTASRTCLLGLLVYLTTPALAKGGDEACERPQDQLDAVDTALYEVWKADKSDRDESNPDMAKNDAKRVKDVAKLDEKGQICSPLNAFHAAWILQRSTSPVHIQKAHEYAKRAMEARIQNGAWLAAVTFDLLQVTYGHPQRYGTQMTSDKGRTCLFPIAADATDEERQQYQIRPIADTYKMVLELNAVSAAATAQSVAIEKLWCEPRVVEGALAGE